MTTTDAPLKLVEPQASALNPAPAASGPCCATCKFWREDPESEGAAGDCRRNAPRPAFDATVAQAFLAAGEILGGGQPRTQWPELDWVRREATWPSTKVDDWCGEFEIAPGKGPSFV